MKYNLIVPMAGEGQRFKDKGFKEPKQFIKVKDKYLLDYSLESIKLEECNIYFVIKDKNLLPYLKGKGEVIVLDNKTQGSAHTALIAAKQVKDTSLPLIIHNLDVSFYPVFDPNTWNTSEGLILTFKSNSTNYSYVKVVGDSVETAEKKVISDNAATGIYCFPTTAIYISMAELMMESPHMTVNNEYYVCPIYNIAPFKTKILPVEKQYVFGTPTELETFQQVVKVFGEKPIALCCDHSGFAGKEHIKKVLNKYNVPYIDFGSFSDTICDYPDYVKLAVDAIKEGTCDFGIGVCRSGQGVNITANKFNNIISVLVHSAGELETCMEHNLPNFFSFPENIALSFNYFYIMSFLSTFDGGRHQVRIQKVHEIR